MEAIIAAVRGQEAKYRDIEYVVKITTRAPDRHDPDRDMIARCWATRHVVLERERIFLRKYAYQCAPATEGKW
jgi:hypothetical protein